MFAFAQQPDNVIAMPLKSNEWYTPARYIEAARAVMGSIDLDPASCKEANMVVRAEKFYTKHENGLEQPWYGRVWLNPPFGKTEERTSNIYLFTRKCVDEYKAGNIEQAIILTTTRTDTPFFDLLWEFSLCFANHVVRFTAPITRDNSWDGKYTHMHGTSFAYLGKNEQKFIDVFSEIGWCIPSNVAVRKLKAVNLSLWEVS